MKEKTVKANREYKDSVFVDLFSGQGEFSEGNIVSLYNALHDEKIDKETSVEFVRLVNVLYHKLRNDVSCIVNGKVLVLIEHQSTINENMPLRCLEYVVELYKKILDAESKYGKTLIKIPTPEFYVFYNGFVSYKARDALYLSTAFMQKQEKFQLELKVNVININHPDNEDFLKSCKILEEYKMFVDKVVEFRKEYGDEGYDKAIDYCIVHGILGTYLKENSKVVRNMLTAEYDYNTELSVARREAREKGREEGREERTSYLAKSFRDMGVSLDKISKATGFSIDEIERL
ncbi:MAG: Rpn family recombination-promoting nuclease/putative transposase [Treponema sp.]